MGPEGLQYCFVWHLLKGNSVYLRQRMTNFLSHRQRKSKVYMCVCVCVCLFSQLCFCGGSGVHHLLRAKRFLSLMI